jgi:hypothetical protein
VLTWLDRTRLTEVFEKNRLKDVVAVFADTVLEADVPGAMAR